MATETTERQGYFTGWTLKREGIIAPEERLPCPLPEPPDDLPPCDLPPDDLPPCEPRLLSERP